MIVTTFPLGNEDQKIGEEGAFKPFLWDGHNSSSSQHIGMKPWVISTATTTVFSVKSTKLYGQRGFLFTYMLTRFARHQFQNAKVAPHPSVNIWQIANHSIWHKEHLFFASLEVLCTSSLSLKLSSLLIFYILLDIINISSCSQKYCLYIFCFKRVDGGCEDTYNDNLWGTNCNNFVDSLACSD